jgi:hypothetical protein
LDLCSCLHSKPHVVAQRDGKAITSKAQGSEGFMMKAKDRLSAQGFKKLLKLFKDNAMLT